MTLPTPRRVTVFCSSSGDIAPLYLRAAAELGRRHRTRGAGSLSMEGTTWAPWEHSPMAAVRKVAA